MFKSHMKGFCIIFSAPFILLLGSIFLEPSHIPIVDEFSLIGRRNQNNWAVIISTSRFWHNYRHNSNALSFYNFLKGNGLSDDRIVLMLAEGIPCNTRNSLPGGVFSEDYNLFYNLNRQTMTIECADTDYKEDEVTVSNFIRVLTGKHNLSTPNKKRLLSDENSNIFIFLTGHGGDGFLKFQDFEEMTSLELSNAIKEMKIQKRYKSILIISETCQASTLHDFLDFENVYAIGCSSLGESSYSKHYKVELGIASIDRFTHFSLLDLKALNKNKLMPIISLVGKYSKYHLKSTPQLKYKLGNIDINNVYVNPFFFPESKEIIPLTDIPSDDQEKDEVYFKKSEYRDFLLFKQVSLDDKSEIYSPTECQFNGVVRNAIKSLNEKAVFNPFELSKKDNKLLNDSYLAYFGIIISILLGFSISNKP
ncbi:Peptidase C13 family protein [Cryptosporidium felis]|nr:Peptidase C13 family protein [Cryptosporidium felis]